MNQCLSFYWLVEQIQEMVISSMKTTHQPSLGMKYRVNTVTFFQTFHEARYKNACAHESSMHIIIHVFVFRWLVHVYKLDCALFADDKDKNWTHNNKNLKLLPITSIKWQHNKTRIPRYPNYPIEQNFPSTINKVRIYCNWYC